MQVRVEQISGQEGSTIGYGFGTLLSDETIVVVFAGDARQMVASALEAQAAGEPFIAEIEEWAVIDRLELPGL